MKVLVMNAGSSSLKYQLIDMATEEVMAKGICERIGIDGGTLTHTPHGGEKIKSEIDMPDHSIAIKHVLDALLDEKVGVIKSMSEISAVGHRVVHGGESFKGSVIIDESVKETIKACADLAPLHNPANIIGIEACEKAMPGVPMVAVFDTAFHQTMPDYAYMYALPYEYYEKYKVRRYGFHGTSHKYVSARANAMLGRTDTKLVTCHLGNGSSITAIKDGKCFDTTMGLTPLEGVMMGTRCGSIDPAIIPFLMQKENLTAAEIDTIMNKKSGILGVTGGKTSDNRDIEGAAKAGDERAQLIESMLCHQFTKYIGGYAAAMGGIDAVVFTGGIGENNPQYRSRVAEKLAFMGVKIDESINAQAFRTSEEFDISAPDAKVRMLVIPTNEELEIALDTVRLLKK